MHRRRAAFRHDEPRRRPTGLPEPGDDPVQRRHRRHGLLLEERLLPGDPGGLDAGHGEALRHGALDPAVFAGQHELPRGGAVVAPRHRQRREVGCRGTGEHGARSLDRPVFGRRTRLSPLGLRLDSPLDCELAPESGKGSLLPEEGPARRTRVPQHQVVHRPAAGELGGRQRGPEPEPDDADTGRAEGAHASRWRAGCSRAIRRRGRDRSSFRPSPRSPRSRGEGRPSGCRPIDEPGNAAPVTNRPPPDPCWGR